MSDDLTEVQAAVVPDGFVINLWQRGFGRTVGPFYSRRDEATKDEVMAFRVEEHHANGMNNCHGGMLMSFADMAWGRVVSNKREIGWVTVRLTTDFLSGALMGDWVEGTSEIIAEQDDIFTVRGKIWCGDRTLITGTGVYKGIRAIQRKAGYRETQGSGLMPLDPAIKEGAPVGYEDQPIHSEPGALPPEVQALLAPFKGQEPDAPKWFTDAIAHEPERTFVTSKGSKLELLTWGEVGKPGLLMVHGNSAHADWWSFIAPFLATEYRVASMSLAGMGASDWRETYAFDDFAEDAEACAQAAGLYEGGRKPVYIGHSFGGSQVFFAAVKHPERMHAAILVDVGFGGPPPDSPEGKRMMEEQRQRDVRNIPTSDRAQRVYPTIEQALARFRFMPPQVAGNLFVADFIARRSLKRAPLEDGSGEGWSWRFDPNMWNKLDRSAMAAMTAGGQPKVTTPLAHIYGERSVVMSRRASGQQTPLPEDIIEIAIPDSAHHIMVDQPLALVAALRSMLAVWPA